MSAEKIRWKSKRRLGPAMCRLV